MENRTVIAVLQEFPIPVSLLSNTYQHRDGV